MDPVSLKKIVHDVTRAYIQKALRATNGHRGEAAKLLGIKRTTLVMKMQKLGVVSEVRTRARITIKDERDE